MTRETGSHLRLTTQLGGEHHFTIPDHSNLRIGTLVSILAEVAERVRITRSTLAAELFER